MKKSIYIALVAFITMFAFASCGSKTEEKVEPTTAERYATSIDALVSYIDTKGMDFEEDELIPLIQEYMVSFEVFLDSEPTKGGCPNLDNLIEKQEKLNNITSEFKEKLSEDVFTQFQARFQKAAEKAGLNEEWNKRMEKKVEAQFSLFQKPKN